MASWGLSMSSAVSILRLSRVPNRAITHPNLCVRPFSDKGIEFFSYSSGRAKRRRARLNRRLLLAREQQKKKEAKIASTEHDDEDTRTVMDILFPNPHRAEIMADAAAAPKKERKSFSQYLTAMKEGWKLYSSTWEGFTTSTGFFVETPAEREAKKKAREEQMEEIVSRGEVIKKNTMRNVQVIQEETLNLRKTVRHQTGIHTIEDLKKLAAEAMTLFAESVKSFMSGYRKGRDDEVEKMMTEYFQDLENHVNKPRRRKRKRRVIY